MPTENQHLAQRVAAHQSDLNARDQALDDAATENNERELSRRDWFEVAQVAEKRVAVLEQALRFYSDGEHYHFESGNWDTVSGEPLNILWCGDEPDFIEDGTVARNALSACAEPSAPVERDERAEFDLEHERLWPFPSQYGPATQSDHRQRKALRLEGWQARAALDKATEGCVHEFIPFTKGCSKCGEPYSAEGASHE